MAAAIGSCAPYAADVHEHDLGVSPKKWLCRAVTSDRCRGRRSSPVDLLLQKDDVAHDHHLALTGMKAAHAVSPMGGDNDLAYRHLDRSAAG